MKLIIGTDADGVLTNLHEFNYVNGKKFFKREAVKYDAYSSKEMFGVSELDDIKFGIGYLGKYCKEASPRPELVNIMNLLYNEGHEVHCITARKFTTFRNMIGKYYRKLFENWCQIFSRKFDSIQYCSEKDSPNDKYIACHKLDVDVMIEDKPDVALYLAEHGIKVILMDAPYNKDCKHENITRVFNWEEVYIEIKKIEKIKEAESENSEDFKKIELEERKKFTDSEKKQYNKKQRQYLKNIDINEDELKKGERKFRLLYNVLYLPMYAIFRPKVYGLDNVPYQDGLIFASNHVNNYDQFIINLAIGKRMFYGFAASTIENTPRAGMFKLTKGAIFMDRESKESKEKSEEQLSAYAVHDKNTVIFPEGTRKNKDKEGRKKIMNPFKLGTVSIAQKTGNSIVPTSINYGKFRTVIRFAKPMTIKYNDDLVSANNELENTVLNMTLDTITTKRK
jgi:1-acyl-sn-glycerol-3-phosphate acyltransferase